MKRKSLLTLALVGALTVGGTVVAFASDSASSVGGGFRQNGTTGVQSLMDEGKTFEEAKSEMLEVKYDRVDAAVEAGNITPERGEEIKAEMAANSATCTTPGENRDNSEGCGLNIGMGRGNGQGRGMGRGNCGIN